MSRWTAAALIGLATATGCDRTEVLSDYSLQLVPRIPENQDPFSEPRSVSLVVDDADGAEITTLGDMESGSLSAEAFGPLEEAMVGVLVQTTDATADVYEPEHLVAYGEVGPFDLDLGLETEEHEVLLAQAWGVGDFGDLGYHGALLAGAAMLSNGDALLFGGAGMAGPLQPGTDKVRRLSDLDGGSWTFKEVTTLPTTLVAASATRVVADGEERILVAGGRTRIQDFLGTASWHLYDPSTDDFTLSGDDMEQARSGHLSQLLSNGHVLLFGGLAEDGLPHSASYELFDPDRARFESFPSIELPCLGGAVADMGVDGALVCGGSEVVGTQYVEAFLAVNECARIDLNGEASEFPPLPLPLQHLALAPLGDGRVLACGGTTGEVDYAGTGPALSDAWVYEPEDDQWFEVAPMVHARAHHVAIPTPDGRVLIIGGSAEGGHLPQGYLGEEVTCPEVFDPVTLEFEIGSVCSLTGSGAAPRVAWHPDHGAVVVAGMDGEEKGGRYYGFVGFGPDLHQ